MKDKHGEFLKFVEIVKKYGTITASIYDDLNIPNKPARTSLRRWFGGWDELLNLTSSYISHESDQEIIDENIKLAERAQKFMDRNRIERKSFRSQARVNNAVGEYAKELINVFNQYSLKAPPVHHQYASHNNAVGIVHFTDAHFNELVELSNNQSDFEIAAKRCKLLVDKAKKYFNMQGIIDVLFAMTGDLINSDRRLDELLSMATNRARASFLAVKILKQMFMELRNDYNITVACVTGNESRIQKDIAYTDLLVTDNYDFTIFNILKLLFKDVNSITFITPNDFYEEVVNVNGQNILLTHGKEIGSKVEHTVQEIKGKWAAKGVIIDFVIFGHLHSARIGDTYARGSSLTGANDYSDKALQLTSRASQNIHILYNNKTIDSIKLDLQNVDDVKGYVIDKDLEEYNAKSASKLHKPMTIMEITI